MHVKGHTMDRPGSKSEGQEGGRDAAMEDALEQIRQALTGLRYGQVIVIVQDGVVVQVERTERRRLRRGDS
jgi:hypothetical protein